MSFNLSYLTRNITRTSVLTLSTLSLAILSGCSNGDFKGASQSAAAEKLNSLHNADPFDSYYGLPKKASYNAQQKNGSKIVRNTTSSPFKAGAPTRYVVKKGDTLWAISNKFLKNPAYWPEVWDKNQKVQNPHLIFPGDVLFIYQGRGNGGSSSSSTVEKLVPQMRVERNSNVGEPISTLSPFLSWPRVLDENAINNAPYIVDAKNANILLEVDQTVYVKNLKDTQAGGEYAIFNVGKILSDPKTGKEYGREVVYNGFLEVERPSTHAEVATALVIESKREIKRGDRLLYIDDETHNLKAPITIPDRKIRGNIISLFDAELISGQTQIITINQGKRQGIKAGFTLGVYSPGKLVDDPIARTVSKHKFDISKPVKVGIPPSQAATAIVYKVLNDISYAVITDSTSEVKNGYKIGNP
ncbi:MAG: LysM peptidoglycan-binding domain-containing protein [Cocleimonas sp.]